MDEPTKLSEGAGMRYTPPWMFGVLELPFGASIGFLQTAVPYWLAQRGVPLAEIGAVSGLGFMPHAWKILWVPLIDASPWRKAWYLISALAVAGFLAAAMMVPNPQEHEALFLGLVIGSGIGSATCSAALEALMATTTREDQKGRAGGFFMAGNVGGTSLLGPIPIYLASHLSPQTGALILGGIVVVSALPVIFIQERATTQTLSAHPGGAWVASWHRVTEIARDLWQTAKSREAITGLIVCAAPVGCGALTNLFSGMAGDFHLSEQTVEALGLPTGLVSAVGSVAGGFITDRMNRRLAYCLAGGLTALTALAMAVAPSTSTTYIWGTLAYNFANAIAFAAFAGLVLEMVSHGAAVTTKYTLFVAVSNQAISYTTWLDGRAPGLSHHGAVGSIVFDALLTFAGIGIVGAMVLIARRIKPAPLAAA